MKWLYLTPDRVDLSAQLALMKPAFNGSDLPKQEFEQVSQWVRTGQVGFYQVSMSGVNLRFIGKADGGVYHIVAMTGRGLGLAAPHIIAQIANRGFKAITFHTYRKGMRRILTTFGFKQVECIREFGGKRETVHRLDLTGGSNG